MNNKLLSAILITGIAATGFAGYSSADDSATGTLENTVKEFPKFGTERGWKMKGTHLTDEEKRALEAMSVDEKQAFLEEHRAEKKAERAAKEAVIDALLAGETLSAEQEILRTEIIAQRAERKALQAEREENRAAIQAIKAKQEAGETLSDDEQAILDAAKNQRKGGKGGKMGRG